MRFQRFALEFWVKLDSDKPGMIGYFHNFNQAAIGTRAREIAFRWLRIVVGTDC